MPIKVVQQVQVLAMILTGDLNKHWTRLYEQNHHQCNQVRSLDSSPTFFLSVRPFCRPLQEAWPLLLGRPLPMPEEATKSGLKCAQHDWCFEKNLQPAFSRGFGAKAGNSARGFSGAAHNFLNAQWCFFFFQWLLASNEFSMCSTKVHISQDSFELLHFAALLKPRNTMDAQATCGLCVCMLFIFFCAY